VSHLCNAHVDLILAGCICDEGGAGGGAGHLARHTQLLNNGLVNLHDTMTAAAAQVLGTVDCRNNYIYQTMLAT
jgi:hypothetical protein